MFVKKRILFIEIARIVTNYTFKEMLRGKYDRFNPQEGDEFADQKEFRVNLNANNFFAY